MINIVAAVRPRTVSQRVNKSQRIINKQHEVFEPSFDQKECFTLKFLKQKADYIHNNPCRKGLACLPEDYKHSSAAYYVSGKHRVYQVITYMELQDVGTFRCSVCGFLESYARPEFAAK